MKKKKSNGPLIINPAQAETVLIKIIAAMSRDSKKRENQTSLLETTLFFFHGTKSIPRPQKIIIDEAHKIEHETTSACSLEVSQTQLKQIENSLKTMQGIGALFYLLAQHESSPGESTPLINKIRTDVTSYAEMLSDQLTH